MTSSQGTETKLHKSFPVFDCDAHINDPLRIWKEFVEPEYEEAVRRSYWRDDTAGTLNGREVFIGGEDHRFPDHISGATIAGPGMTLRLQRRLHQMKLTPEQISYCEHQGAFEGHARLRDMDLMGIDQVLVIPTRMNGAYPFVEDVDGAVGLARAYNNWVQDYCSAAPDRLFPAAWLPVQSVGHTVAEIHRTAEMGFKVALLRPIDAGKGYPNGPAFDPVFRAIAEAGMVAGMHTFPCSSFPQRPGPIPTSPAEIMNLVQRGVSQTLPFVFEAQVWLAQMLLSGFLDHHPNLRMAIFESNATWLPRTLDRCDRLFELYRNERLVEVERRPSEAFREQCLIAFESDEVAAFRQWDYFEDIGIWSSDAYHADGADVWSAIRAMNEEKVPESVQAKLLGANARRFYGIEPRTYVSDEADVPRPEWFPKQDAEFEEWWARESDPRRADARGVAVGAR